ncbi:MAG: Anaphase-promoting complex subunit 1 [Stictis urceolatum]|nr:Anaphase-promoting complex subunit 1 [Stictis urceolata]
MASVRSLGISTPSAIPYLVKEGHLPPDPDPSLYTLKTFAIGVNGQSQTFEELLYTESCVAWSRGGILRKIYTFGIEGEAVKHALFAQFHNDLDHKVSQGQDKGAVVNGNAGSDAGSLPVPQQRSTNPTNAAPNSDTRSNEQYSSRVPTGGDNLANVATAKRADDSRALVVLLKSQAHIYFLTGTHYLVHLPFEVAAVFSLPTGILLQRKLKEKDIADSFQQPPAPFNSFVFSPNVGSTSQQPHLQDPLPSAFPSDQQDDCPPAIRSMLDSILGEQQRSKVSAMPAHFLLRDPLAEFGVVVERPETPQKVPSKHTKVLDPHENIIYISTERDHSGASKEAIRSPPVLLAISANKATGQYNIWSVTDIKSAAGPSDRRISTTNSGAVSRRRSSFGPTPGTATPALRSSMGPRESFGPTKDSLGADDIHDDQELASQLDPAFENSGAPPRASRRISSLLARSELSGNRDTSNLTDLTAGHSKGAVRRGPSFGGPGGRRSFGLQGTQDKTRRNVSASHMHADGLLGGAKRDVIAGPSDSDDDSSGPEINLMPASSPLQQELGFTRIHTFGAISSFAGSQSTAKDPLDSIEVFRLDPPSHTNPQRDGTHSILCIIDRGACQFFIIHLVITPVTAKRRDIVIVTRHRVKVTDVKRGQGVVDACKVTDGPCSRVLVLGSTEHGSRQLSLQSPWSVQAMLPNPHQFLIHNPFDLNSSKSLLQRREGGFKRVLSQGPADIIGLHQCPARGHFELRDSAGANHRLQVNLHPESPFILKALQTCEFVVPVTDGEREPLQRFWWDVMQWISQNQMSGDLEWKAFLVVLFTLFIGNLDESKAPKALRPRRKGGLLRSSSGAIPDLEDFDQMMKIECSAKGSLPRWMQQRCWSWLADEQVASDYSQKASPQGHTGRVSDIAQAENGSSPFSKKATFLPETVALARDFVKTEAGLKAVGEQGYLPTALSVDATSRDIAMPTVLLALHLLREELKLDMLAGEQLHMLTPVLAQLGGWMGWEDWGWKSSSFYMLESADMERLSFNEGFLKITTDIRQPIPPPSILEFVEIISSSVQDQTYPTLVDVATSERSPKAVSYALSELTPRTTFVLKLLRIFDSEPSAFLALVEEAELDLCMLDTLPEGIAAPLRASIVACQASPGSSLSRRALQLIDRSDISMLEQGDAIIKPQFKATETINHDAVRDFHTICNTTLEIDQVGAYDGSAEMDRQAVTRMVFKEDQRFAEAAKLVHPLKRAVARCYPEEEWSDTDLLEAQQEVAKIVAIRTLSVSPGRGMLFYSARFPLLTEKFPIHGFSLSCIMKPTNTIVTADKNIYTEEKVSWAFFHAGVEAGLSISKEAQGIDTSWILFNKPPELNNRHAGFLLALGLNGHLKNIAKWVAFKYLTPKHTMTSIGLLLGLAASYLGTMDTLITRLLSVHVTRMLPPGAAELNLSPLTQTTGIMAIGLLYCNTQHRRMSEIMLSEMENIDLDDTNSPLENLRDEGYRLAAGFALGYINLGQGKRMNGLRDMRIVERLLGLAVATKRVDIVHILDKATAAATVAIALIFMKTEDEALAKKIDVPDTTHQFVYVRPDIFLLRTVARHLIMWEGITPTFAWIRNSLPPSLKDQARLGKYKYLNSEQLPLFNILAGLCLSLGLRFAGTARQDVRGLLGFYLDCFMKITATAGTSYDEKLTRITARNCQDVVALAGASVMAGTGDIDLFRRFRILHSRTDPDTPYGSHLAAHQAIGVLFLGGGTHTFNTSNLAVASLLCASYPLFPTAVLDNKSHLQAFRHFWVLASEPRCLVVRNAESRRPLALQILITLRSGAELEARAPCLLPALDSIARISSADPQFWPVTLDFAANDAHRAAFARHQSMFVRRRGAYNASSTVFGTMIRALNDAAMAHQLHRSPFEWIFELPSFEAFDRAEKALVLPSGDGPLLSANVARSTAVDSRLVLEGALVSGRAERLWDLRVLFAWAEKVGREKGEVGWLGKEVLDGLRAKVALMGREVV